jgi:hypothetical protein
LVGVQADHVPVPACRPSLHAEPGQAGDEIRYVVPDEVVEAGGIPDESGVHDGGPACAVRLTW